MKIKTYISSFLIASFAAAPLSYADSASGMASGKRQHKPVTVIKPIDKASPLLMDTLLGDQKAKAGYRLCPDGTMINPGEKCPNSAKK